MLLFCRKTFILSVCQYSNESWGYCGQDLSLIHILGIFVVGNAGGICGIGLICIAAAKGDSNDALAGVDKLSLIPIL